jgi:hypothetical protein
MPKRRLTITVDLDTDNYDWSPTKIKLLAQEAETFLMDKEEPDGIENFTCSDDEIKD